MCIFIMIYRLEVHRVSRTLCVTFTARTTAASPDSETTVGPKKPPAVLRETSRVGPHYIPGQNLLIVRPRLEPTH